MLAPPSISPNIPTANTPGAKADGLHFCGVAHLRLGERELALQRLTAALEIRERWAMAASAKRAAPSNSANEIAQSLGFDQSPHRPDGVLAALIC